MSLKAYVSYVKSVWKLAVRFSFFFSFATYNTVIPGTVLACVEELLDIRRITRRECECNRIFFGPIKELYKVAASSVCVSITVNCYYELQKSRLQRTAGCIMFHLLQIGWMLYTQISTLRIHKTIFFFTLHGRRFFFAS